MVMEPGSKIMKLSQTYVKLCLLAKTLNIEHANNLNVRKFYLIEILVIHLCQIKNL